MDATAPANHGILGKVKATAQSLKKETERLSNPIPLDAFPLALQNIAKALKDSLLFPLDYTLVSMLYSISLSSGNAIHLKVRNGWIEAGILWCVLVGKPGVSKSHPLAWATAPIKKWDSVHLKQHALNRGYYKNALAEFKKAKDAAGVVEPTEPTEIITILSDYTFEALIDRHSKNRKSVGILMDEILGITKNFGRYSGGGSEQQQLLTAYSRGQIRSTRKAEDSKNIDDPFINIIGCIQPDRLSELTKDGRDKDGFMDRLIAAWPDDVKKEYWSDNELDDSVALQYTAYINKLLERKVEFDNYGNIAPTMLSFTQEAKAILKNWQKVNTDKWANEDSEAAQAMFSKLEVTVVRLSLILQIAYYACGETELTNISERAINGAIKLTEYFRQTALKIHSYLIGDTNPLAALKEDLRELYSSLPETFKYGAGIEFAATYWGDNIPRGTIETRFKALLKKPGLFKVKTGGTYTKMLVD